MKKKIIIISIILTTIVLGGLIIVLNTKKDSNVEKEELNNIYNEKVELENQKEEIESQIEELEKQKNEGSNKHNTDIDKQIEELKNQKNDIEQDIKEKEEQVEEIKQNKPSENKKPEIEPNKPNEDKTGNTSQKQNTITVSKSHITVEENLTSDPIKISFSRGIENILDYHINYKYSNEGIAGVGWNGSFDGNIYIYGYKAGTTTITITDLDDPGPSVKIYVTVTPKTRVNNLTLDTKTINGFVGKSYDIKATLTPSNAQEKFIYWTSSNPLVATVTWGGGDPSTGIVKAVGKGTAIITAKSKDGGYQASATINVSPIEVKGIEITTRASLNYHEGDTLQLKYKINPFDATNQKVTWKSSNTTIATVDEKGLVTFHKGIAGKNVNITVTTEDGNFSDKITLYCVPSNTN